MPKAMEKRLKRQARKKFGSTTMVRCAKQAGSLKKNEWRINYEKMFYYRLIDYGSRLY